MGRCLGAPPFWTIRIKAGRESGRYDGQDKGFYSTGKGNPQLAAILHQ